MLSSVREGNFIASFDLKDAYFQFPIFLSLSKYLHLFWNEVVFSSKVLCFLLHVFNCGVISHSLCSLCTLVIG